MLGFRLSTGVKGMAKPSAVSGLTFAFELLVQELSKTGAIDRARYLAELKNAYNHSDGVSEAAQLLHTIVRQLEHGVKKRKK